MAHWLTDHRFTFRKTLRMNGPLSERVTEKTIQSAQHCVSLRSWPSCNFFGCLMLLALLLLIHDIDHDHEAHIQFHIIVWAPKYLFCNRFLGFFGNILFGIVVIVLLAFVMDFAWNFVCLSLFSIWYFYCSKACTCRLLDLITHWNVSPFFFLSQNGCVCVELNVFSNWFYFYFCSFSFLLLIQLFILIGLLALNWLNRMLKRFYYSVQLLLSCRHQQIK